jgi:cytochrome P450
VEGFVLAGNITNAPHVHRARAVLDSRDMAKNAIGVFESYRARLGPTFTVHFGGVKPAVVTSDPAIIEHVLKENRDNYIKSHIQVERMVEFQGRGVVNIHGEEWLRQRRLMAQGFKAGHLSKLLPVQNGVVEELFREFDLEAARGPVDVHKQLVRFMLRLVGRAVFGRSMSVAELDQIGDTIETIQRFIMRQVVQPYMIPWFRLSGESERHQRLRRAADAIALRHIQTRRAEGIGETDLLRILLQTPYHDTGEPMPEALAMIESFQLVVAGNETSSNAMTWILYLLARHPEHILAIRDEVNAVIGDDPIDFHKLHSLHRTLRVIDEALRLYPPFWMIDRIALGDDEVAGVRIPKGAMVIPYIYGTHRNPAHWTDVDAFDPSRFEADRVKARHPFAHIPFGGGPRICLGGNLAMMQILLLVATFARRYDFRMATDQPVGIKPMMLLRPGGVVAMHFRPVS